MKRWARIASVSLMAVAQMADARDDWYEPGITLDGDVAVGQVSPGVRNATVHVRMRAGRWSLSWPSPAGQCRATLVLPSADRADDVYVAHAYVIIEADGLTEEYRVDGDVSYDGFNSMKIDYDGVTATLVVGDGIAREVAPVPFGPGEVSVSVPYSGVCQRMRLSQQSGAAGAGSVDGSAELLVLRVSASEDNNEGVWEYFGKDADASNTTVGGRYVLATVADDKGGYDIVYLAGATANTDGWRPMMLKGRMLSTIFADDFDLEWIDAGGMPVEGDTYARMSADHSQLTFGFPEHGATLKFRRVAHADVIRKAALSPR